MWRLVCVDVHMPLDGAWLRETLVADRTRVPALSAVDQDVPSEVTVAPKLFVALRAAERPQLLAAVLRTAAEGTRRCRSRVFPVHRVWVFRWRRHAAFPGDSAQQRTGVRNSADARFFGPIQHPAEFVRAVRAAWHLFRLYQRKRVGVHFHNVGGVTARPPVVTSVDFRRLSAAASLKVHGTRHPPFLQVETLMQGVESVVRELFPALAELCDSARIRKLARKVCRRRNEALVWVGKGRKQHCELAGVGNRLGRNSFVDSVFTDE